MVRVIYERFDRRVLTVRIEGAPEGAAKMVTKVCRGERFLDAEFVSVRKSGEVFFASWRLTSNKFPVLHVFEGVRYCLQQDINKRLWTKKSRECSMRSIHWELRRLTCSPTK